MRLQLGKRSLLIDAHRSAEAGDIGGKDGGEAALDAFFGHAVRLPLENAVPLIVLGRREGVHQARLPLRVMGCRRRTSAAGRLYLR